MSDTLAKRKIPVVTRMRFGLTTFLVLIMAFAAYESLSFPRQARLYPLVVSLLGLVVAALSLSSDIRRYRAQGTAVGKDVPSTASTASYEPGAPIGYVFARAGRYLAWCGLLLLLIYVIGMKAAAMLFLTAFLWIESPLRRIFIPLAPIGIFLLLSALQAGVNLRWPNALFELLP